MQTLKEIQIIRHALLGPHFRIKWPAAAEKHERFVDGSVPQDLSWPIGFQDVLRIGIKSVFKIILKKIQRNGQRIPRAAVRFVTV